MDSNVDLTHSPWMSFSKATCPIGCLMTMPLVRCCCNTTRSWAPPSLILLFFCWHWLIIYSPDERIRGGTSQRMASSLRWTSLVHQEADGPGEYPKQMTLFFCVCLYYVIIRNLFLVLCYSSCLSVQSPWSSERLLCKPEELSTLWKRSSCWIMQSSS